MRKKKEKGYWEKKKERFPDGPEAKFRAGYLRSLEHVQHVHVSKKDNDYIVSYSVAKSYLEQIKRAGITL